MLKTKPIYFILIGWFHKKTSLRVIFLPPQHSIALYFSTHINYHQNMIDFSQSKTFKYLFTYLMDEVLQDFLNFMPFLCFCSSGHEKHLEYKHKTAVREISAADKNPGMLSRVDEGEGWVTAWITYMHGLIYSGSYRWYNIHCSHQNIHR